MKAHEKLRELMRRRNLSQEDLAQRLGLSQSMVSSYLRGKSVRGMRAGIAKQICDTFDVSMDWFFDEKQGLKSDEDLLLEKQIAQLVNILGLMMAFQRLAKVDTPSLANGGISPNQDFGPIGLSGSQDAPAPRAGKPKDARPRRSNG